MLSETLLAVASDWPGATNVRACEVKIGRQTYEGFAYNVPEDRGTSDGTRHFAGEQRFWLSGELPPSANRRAVYRIDGDDGDWFLGSYITRETAESAEFRARAQHPLGAHFLLMRWPHERFGDRIDAPEIGRHGRIHPYPRMRIEVTYASPTVPANPIGELLMLSETLLDVARGWPGATNVRACEVKIGRQTYEGFSYTTPEKERRFYLLGDRPPSSKRHVYRIDGDEGDWFLGAYGSPEGEHPLGAHFLLMRWPHEQFTTRIDAHEIGRHGRTHPYPRMRIEVIYAEN